MWLAILLFVIGLGCLVKGGDWFVRGAVDLAAMFRIPELIVGATVVAIGTTLPEVMVSANAALKGVGSMSYGNAIGSIICNTALISALTIAIRPSDTDRKSLILPVSFFFFAAACYLIISYGFGRFNRGEGIFFLITFVAYIFISVKKALAESKKNPGADDPDVEDYDDPLWKALLFLVIGAALIAVGAKFMVDYGTVLAVYMGVPNSVIALTFIAIGTSLPELVTATVALAKGHGALSLGNIIGANLFNLILVNGVAITLAPYDLPVEKTICNHNSALVLDLPLMLLVMLILTVPALLKQKLERWQGVLLLALYMGFVVLQFAV
ncbi:MAG: calcium/sodium antiporter [Lachnospiraceae bacterium]|nr:calcium/sodium antiporter [Lachnospiraceae bacterium]